MISLQGTMFTVYYWERTRNAIGMRDDSEGGEEKPNARKTNDEGNPCINMRASSILMKSATAETWRRDLELPPLMGIISLFKGTKKGRKVR